MNGRRRWVAVVGVMMAYVMGAEGKDTLDRAADLGIALQLTNIARDVMDDASAGRVYLPRDWLAESGVPADEIQQRRHRGAVHYVVRRMLAEADRGILFRPPQNVIDEFPQYPVVDDYDSFRLAFREASVRDIPA